MKRPGVQPRGTGTDTPCPRCARTFLVGPEFVFETHPTGRAQRSGRRELRCQICGNVWWSKRPARRRS